MIDEVREDGRAVPRPRTRRCSPRCASRRSGTAASCRARRSRRSRRARRDARVLQGGRDVLRHVPPRARRPARWSRSARTSRARSSARRRCSRRSRTSSASARARRPTTARSRSAWSSARAAAAVATVVAVDHRYREHVTAGGRPPRSWRSCGGDGLGELRPRGRRRARPDEARRVPRRRRLRAAREGAAMEPAQVVDEITPERPARARRRRLPDGPQGEPHREATRASRRTSSSTPTSPSPGTFKDREMMARVPHRLIEGCLITAHAIGRRTCSSTSAAST